MKRHFLVLLFALTSSLLVAQKDKCTKIIHGRILELGTETPVAFALVKIEGTSIGATSDEKGEFTLRNVCPDEIHLEISHVSYRSISHHHDAYHSSPTIYLAPKEIELDGLVIEEKVDKTKIETLATQRKSISQSGADQARIGNLLEKMSGVSTLQTGSNVVKPLVHGLHSNRVLIINNGVRHAYQAWGREHAPEIDPGAIDQLTLVKGAATVRYGPEALGGVILLDPKSPAFDQSIQGSVGTTLESNGRSAALQTQLSQGYHRLAWNAGITVRKQGDLHTPEYQLTNTGSNELGFHAQGIWHRPKFDLSLYVSHFDQELGILRGSVVGNIQDLSVAMNTEPPQDTRPFSYEIRTPRQETVHDLYKIKGSVFLADHEVNLQYALQRNQRREYDIRRGTNNQRPSIDLDMLTHTFDGEWTYPSERWKGLVGLQATYQDNNNNPGTNTIPFVPNYNVLNLGIYSMQSTSWNQSQFEAGARYDFQQIDARGRDQSNDLYGNVLKFNNATFLLGYGHQLSPTWKFTANIASAWRPPNVGELYSFGKNQFNVEYGFWRYEIDESGDISTSGVGDQNSKPVKSEKGLKGLLSLEYKKEKVNAEVVAYANRIVDYFFLRPYGVTNTSRGPFPYFIHDQTNALFYGVDFDMRVMHSADLTSEIRLAYVHATDSKNDQPFLEIPPLNVQYDLKKNIGSWSFGLSAEYTARQFHAPTVIPVDDFLAGTESIEPNKTFDFLSAPRGYALLHSHIEFHLSKWTFTIHARNMLNTSYRVYMDRLRYFADNPGRNFTLTAQFKFGK